jgi:hypothetical protein
LTKKNTDLLESVLTINQAASDAETAITLALAQTPCPDCAAILIQMRAHFRIFAHTALLILHAAADYDAHLMHVFRGSPKNTPTRPA